MTGPVRGRLAAQVDRFRRGGRPSMLWALRLTAAAVLSYVVADAIFAEGRPLLAPLTALLVIQVTPISLLASGVDRVASVVAGVVIAVGFAAVVPLSWWSLGILLLVSIMVGQALRLQANLVEVPITAMLVLGVRATETEFIAWQRISETLVGAGVGIAVTLLFPPRAQSGGAAQSIRDLAAELTGLLDGAADEMTNADRDQIATRSGGWLADARRITHDMPGVGAALHRSEQSRRLNVRSVRTLNPNPGLRQGLEALEHSAVSVRSMFRGVHDAFGNDAWPEGAASSQAIELLTMTLRDISAAISAFGKLVYGEAVSRDLRADDRIPDVTDALSTLHAARDRLTEAHDEDANPAVEELIFTLLTTVKRVLSEMDLEERMRRQDALRPPPRRPLPPLGRGASSPTPRSRSPRRRRGDGSGPAEGGAG